MSGYGLRQKAGALLYDWPRFGRSLLAGRGGWARFHNRDERVTLAPDNKGVRCEWLYGTDLHLCRVFPSTARTLLRRAFAEWPIAMSGAPSGETPRVSFIIGHRGEARRAQLLATLASIGGQRGVAVECVVVEQSARPELPPHLPPWVRHIHTPIASDAMPYNRGWAFNVGVRAARGSLMILHDNDLLVPADYARSTVALHDEGWEIIDPKRFIFYIDREPTEGMLRSHAIPPGLVTRTVTQNLPAGASFVADRAAYLEIGGFDETYVGWGGEDNEFSTRAATRRCWAFGYAPLIHLWHAPQPEKENREPEGVKRFYRDVNVPVAERIARVRAQANGRVDGAFVE
jgi:GT2 family glycosyltransferase